MTCEVRLEGFVDINEIGWYTTIVREVLAAGGRGEATVILIVACVLILLASSRDQPLQGVSAGAYAVAIK
jgi:hypothetical protein